MSTLEVKASARAYFPAHVTHEYLRAGTSQLQTQWLSKCEAKEKITPRSDGNTHDQCTPYNNKEKSCPPCCCAL